MKIKNTCNLYSYLGARRDEDKFWLSTILELYMLNISSNFEFLYAELS
jgi:hypothetical protein